MYDLLCSESQFLNDVKEHKVNVIKNDGLYRHIRFRKPSRSAYYFDLITWNGHLTITGDMGTYVFSRVEDMFEFFRTDSSYKKEHPDKKIFINTGYWSEKLRAVDKVSGVEEFDERRFLDRIKTYFNGYKEEHSKEESDELWDAIDSEILCYIDDYSGSTGGDTRLYELVFNFSHNGFSFEDFFDGGGSNRFSYHFIWCLYAIAWGIAEFDKLEYIKNKD